MGVDFGYRGERLGLPKEGTGSIASPGRRIGALTIDWFLCLLIGYGLLSGGSSESTGNWTLAVFGVMTFLTVGTVGFTPGKRLLGLRVISLTGDRLSLPRVLFRTALLLAVIPPLVWDRDGRGLHDRLTGAMQVRL